MSHSKRTKRGYSLYLEQWNASAKKYVNVCKICGYKGYSPVIDDPAFCNNSINSAICVELKKTLPKLEVDELGRCESCALVQDGKDR